MSPDNAGPAPRLSVLMPVRNGGPYLRAAIESILGQTFGDFEFIIVDDGSTDGSSDVIAGFHDPRIRVIAGPVAGIVGALNAGIAAVRAPLIARMDADDISRPDRFAAQVAYLAAHPAVAVLGSAVVLMDPSGNLLETVRYPCAPDEIGRLGPHVHAIAHPTVMMRTVAVRSAGGYRPQFIAAEDQDLWMRIGDRHDLANLDAPLVHYRTHAGQHSSVNRGLGRAGVALATLLTHERRAGRGEAHILQPSFARSCLAAARHLAALPPQQRTLRPRFILLLLQGAAGDPAARGDARTLQRALGWEAIKSGRLRDAARIARLRLPR